MRIEQFAIPAIRKIVSHPRLDDLVFRWDKWGNPFHPDVAIDPYPSIELMRADGPVAYRKLYQQWIVTGYDEAKTVLGSPAVIVGPQREMLLSVSPYSKLSEQAREFISLWLVFVDPPDHTRLRRLVSRAFTPRRVAELEVKVAELAHEMVGDLRTKTKPDVMPTFCRDLPVAVIGELLGLPRERWEWSRETTETMVQLLSPFESFDADEVTDVIADVHEYWGALADERRRDPQDDLLTALVQAEDDGDRLSRAELVSVIAFLMGAGHETTTSLLGNSIVNLAANPDQRDLIRRKPELWPNAVEELIRYDSAVKLAGRATKEDLEVGGHTIPAGSNIAISVAAANRDPERFDRPNELILDREDPSPLSFGHGAHYCVGHALARMELQIALPIFLEAFGDYEVETDTIEWRFSSALRGPSSVRVIAAQ